LYASSDAAIGLELVFQALAVLMLIAVALACFIPERNVLRDRTQRQVAPGRRAA
jgi:hypothetical protein